MAAWLSSLLQRGSIAVMEKNLAFTEARHRVLLNDIANISTPRYKMRDLPVEEFREAMDEAIRRRSEHPNQPLRLEDTRHLRFDGRGHLQAEPVEIEGMNILFHDQNNRSVEKLMSAMMENVLRHNITAELLKKQYRMMELAIRERL